MNWLKGDLAFTSNSDQQSPKVSRGGVQRENWILAASQSWPRCPSERIVPVTCRRPFRAPQTIDSATSRGLLLFGERSQRSSRSARVRNPKTCRWLDMSPTRSNRVGSAPVLPAPADAPTEVLAQTAVKCSTIHLAAYADGTDQANSSAQSSPGSIINGARMADNKRGEGTESSASTTTKPSPITCCPELRLWLPWRRGI